VTPGKIGLIFGLVAVGAIVVAIATAFAINELFDDDDTDDHTWRTYRSEFLGFEIAYPEDWHIVERLPPDPSKEPYITGGVTISENEDAQSGPKVLAYKNFHGDWCLRGRQEDRDIEVSGVAGVETNCYGCEADAPVETCPADPFTIVRVFGIVGEPDYYVVLGDPEDDLETVRRIVGSFRFTD
jgi:hypothetical protein